MKGGAHQLWAEFCDRHTGSRGNLLRSMVILKARVIPEHLAAGTDDPGLEARLTQAIRSVETDEEPPSEKPPR